MKSSSEQRESCVIIRIEDTRSEPGSAAELKTAFLEQMGQQHVNILVNLSVVEYMDSSVLGALLFGRRQAQTEGGDLRIVAPSERVQSMIEIAQLDRILDIFDTEEEGIASFIKE